MTPDLPSKILLGITRSQAKMVEFAVPTEHHLQLTRNPAALFPLAIGIVGDLAGEVARTDVQLASRLAERKGELRFSAYFFDAFLQAMPDSPEKRHVSLLAAATYYLCNLPGSAMVLTSVVAGQQFDRDCRGLDQTLIWLLRGRFDEGLQLEDPCYGDLVRNATDAVVLFYGSGLNTNEILKLLWKLRQKCYCVGDSRELLFGDLIFAVARHRLEISSRTCLPRYTGLAPVAWEATLAKPTFVREFWPAQRLLGEQGVFQGRSAVVQMPTSAGKTKATEILIRSAFFSQRTKLALVVAPFRALCHEIRDSLVIAFRGEAIRIDEISDVPQDDFFLEVEDENPQVYVLTPEKLLYITRQTPDLAPRIGLLIYDEGHQFDTGLRGVTYELLLTSLKAVVPADCQVVLISAVITNAAAINDWLNGERGSIVAGVDLLPNLRSVAFASWLDELGRLEFMAQPDSADHKYFVPRVLESHALARRGRERVVRYFPTRDDPQSIALYLGLKLVPQGAVAIFCGLKASVTSVCEKLVEAYARQLPLSKPLEVSDAEEVKKLAALIKRHFGDTGPVPECADIGVFTHHGNTPAGVRLAVEFAMKESMIKMVVCTSTLAQGVNLPIRYLIITSVYQGAKRISVRDFQNLIGRAGRSGMHTEGSVIFADPSTFDGRFQDNGWRWGQTQQLLDPANAEICASSLLTLFDPLQNDDHSDQANLLVSAFFAAYLANENAVEAFAIQILEEVRNRGFSTEGLVPQLRAKGQIIDALESFAMAASGEGVTLDEAAAAQLARETLAYHLANQAQRLDLEELFKLIVRHVSAQVPDPKVRKAYSKTLFGIRTSLAIHAWVRENVEGLAEAADDTNLLKVIWPILQQCISSPLFKRCTKPETMLTLAMKWIDEITPFAMLEFLTRADVRFGDGARPRYPAIDHVVELCEDVFAYEGVLVFAAIIEAIQLDSDRRGELVDRIALLQKRLKYGAATATAITLHELGFMDRILARELADILVVDTLSRPFLRRALRRNNVAVETCVERFPAYYDFVWRRVLRRGRRRL